MGSSSTHARVRTPGKIRITVFIIDLGKIAKRWALEGHKGVPDFLGLARQEVEDRFPRGATPTASTQPPSTSDEQADLPDLYQLAGQELELPFTLGDSDCIAQAQRTVDLDGSQPGRSDSAQTAPPGPLAPPSDDPPYA